MLKGVMGHLIETVPIPAGDDGAAMLSVSSARSDMPSAGSISHTFANGAGSATSSVGSRPLKPVSAAPARFGELGRATFVKSLSVLTLIVLWYIAAANLSASVMPAPHKVALVLWQDMAKGDIWSDVAISLARIVVAFIVSMAIGIALGFAMGVSKTAERFFEVWVICGITLPSLVVILTIYMVVGLNDRAAIIGASLPVIPILTINIWEGIKGVDHKLIDMAKSFHAPRPTILGSVIAPQITPALLASARFGLGLVWKMVLFVELLGRSNGIGYQIEANYQIFNMSQVLAHAVLFLVIMLFIEVVLLGQVERYLMRWRPAGRRI